SRAGADDIERVLRRAVIRSARSTLCVCSDGRNLALKIRGEISGVTLLQFRALPIFPGKNFAAIRRAAFCVRQGAVRLARIDGGMNILLKSLPEVEAHFGKKATMAPNLLDMVGQGEKAYGFLTGTHDDG